MIPYFEYTEDVQNFCKFTGYTVKLDSILTKYVCMYSLKYSSEPVITSFHLCTVSNPFIPNENVINYLTLMLNGYSYESAAKEAGVVGA